MTWEVGPSVRGHYAVVSSIGESFEMDSAVYSSKSPWKVTKVYEDRLIGDNLIFNTNNSQQTKFRQKFLKDQRSLIG